MSYTMIIQGVNLLKLARQEINLQSQEHILMEENFMQNMYMQIKGIRIKDKKNILNVNQRFERLHRKYEFWLVRIIEFEMSPTLWSMVFTQSWTSLDYQHCYIKRTKPSQMHRELNSNQWNHRILIYEFTVSQLEKEEVNKSGLVECAVEMYSWDNFAWNINFLGLYNS